MYKNNLTFSQRIQLESEYNDFIRYNKIKDCMNSMIAFLMLKGYVIIKNVRGENVPRRDDCPHVEVPTPHGKPKNGMWVERVGNLWVCTECANIIYSENVYDLQKFHKFCGVCGAAMGVKEND